MCILLKLIRSIKCFVAVVGLFFTAGVANADIVVDVGGIVFFRLRPLHWCPLDGSKLDD